MQEAALMRLGLVDLPPLGYIGLASAIGVAAAGQAVLQDSGLMAKEALVFLPLGANVKTDLRLVEAGVHEEPANASEWKRKFARGDDSTIPPFVDPNK